MGNQPTRPHLNLCHGEVRGSLQCSTASPARFLSEEPVAVRGDGPAAVQRHHILDPFDQQLGDSGLSITKPSSVLSCTERRSGFIEPTKM